MTMVIGTKSTHALIQNIHFNKYVKWVSTFAPRVESWDDTPIFFSCHVYGPHNSYIQSRKIQWVDNEFNNYQRSYNNQGGTLPVHWLAKIPTPVKWVQL